METLSQYNRLTLALIPLGKFINQLCGWRYGPSPRDGRQYWVLQKNSVGPLIIMTADDSETNSAANGWTNGDTYEDFDGDIVAYKLINRPLFLL